MESEKIELKEFIARLCNIENLLIGTKEVLTFDEAAIFTGLSKSYLYKLTSTGAIPHFKPNGKMVYFNRIELEAWLQTNRVATTKELDTKATTFVTVRKSKGAQK